MHSGGKEWGQAQACLAGHLQHRLAKDQDKMFGIFTGDLPVCAASPEVHYGSFSYLVFVQMLCCFVSLLWGGLNSQRSWLPALAFQAWLLLPRCEPLL